MKRTIRLTESELKSIITESVKAILKEGQNDTLTYTHYAVHKPSKKIVNGWDYSGYDPQELKMYKNDYFTADLIDMEMNPKEIAIWGRKKCEREGLNPADDNSWANYFEIVKESLLKEIGDTAAGQEMLGRAAGRAQKRAQNIGRTNNFDKYCDAMGRADKIGNYARDQRIKSTGKPDDSTGAFTKGVKDGKQKEMNEAYNHYSTTTIDINLDEVEFPQPLNDFIDNNYDSMPNTVEVKIFYKYNPYVPATYWQPAEGGDFDYRCGDVLVEPFQDIIPQELLQTFIDTIADYADAHIDDLFERANLNYDDGPDPDEAYETWRDTRNED